MSGRTKNLKSNKKVQEKSQSRGKKETSKSKDNVTPSKPDVTQKQKIKDSGIKGFAKRTGDFAIVSAKDNTSQKKADRSSSSAIKNQKAKKSPHVDRGNKTANSKDQIAKKNAPIIDKKASTRRDNKDRRGIARKDIQIVIESPEKSTPAKSQGTVPSKQRSESKTKQRMQSLLKTKEEDEFMQTVRDSTSPKRSTSKNLPIETKTEKTMKNESIKPKNIAIRGGRKEINNIKTEKDASRVVMKPVKSHVCEARFFRKESINKSESRSAEKVRERSRKADEKKKITGKAAITTKNQSLTPSKKKPLNTGAPIRTPTKHFKKEKTPSPKNAEDESEISETKPVIEKPKSKSRSKSKSKSKSVTRPKITQPKKIFASIKKEKIKVEVVEEEEKSVSSEEKDSSSSQSRNEKSVISSSKIVKRPIKTQLDYKVDAKKISEEISKILNKIEEKKSKLVTREVKKNNLLSGLPGLKRGLVKKSSAKDYDFKLHINPNIKVNHIVRISDLNEKPTKTHTDVLLAILEIASNCEYYNISYLNNSRFFWEDVVQYEELKDIFSVYKGETLRKYWRYLSLIGDVNKISDLVKRHKKFLDEINIKLLSIITAIRGYFSGTITDFEETLKKMQVEIKKHETHEDEIIDEETGEKRKIKVKTTTTKLKNKFEKPEYKTVVFKGINVTGPVDEVLGHVPSYEDTNYSKTIREIQSEDRQKFEFLGSLNAEEKKKILSLNEEDKFLFKTINNIVNALHTEFPQYNKSYIIEVLNGTSMNFERSYLFLLDPSEHGNLIFNYAEDNLILNMKGKLEFSNLEKEKGSDRVQEREDYLMG